MRRIEKTRMEQSLQRIETKIDAMFEMAKKFVERRTEEQGTERHRNHCFLEGNKDSYDPRIEHVDKWIDITKGPGERCELQSRRQGHMPVIHDEEELNRFAEPELGGRCAKELLAGEGLLEANRL